MAGVVSMSNGGLAQSISILVGYVGCRVRSGLFNWEWRVEGRLGPFGYKVEIKGGK